ncbi:MAG: SDR family NAD(P)-dependent oxidoreductase [Marinicella sp.]
MQSLTFIAGGSKGLGAALVKIFENNQHEVLEFSRSGQQANHIDCDFNQTEKALHTFKQTFAKVDEKSVNSINLVINTAVLQPFGSLLKADEHTIEQHIHINITATMYLLKAFITAFQQTPCKKTISYISSGAARRDIPGLAMYSASKAFFERFIDTTATEQKDCDHPIDCMIINPGVMDTGMQVEIRAQDKADFPMVNMWQDLHDQGKLAQPKAIAEVCFNLITHTGQNSGYYTAQNYLRQ